MLKPKKSSAETVPGQKGGWQTPILLLFISTFLAFGTLEIVFRVFFNVAPSTGRLSQDPVHQQSANLKLLYKLTPGAFTTHLGTAHFINRAGFRDREYPVKKNPGTKRILFLGDSVIYGYGLSLEDTLPKQLERLFHEHSSPGTEVLNLGVSGYDTEQEVEFLKETGLAFEPDLVIVGYNLNDCTFASLGLDLLKEENTWQIRTERPELRKKIFGFLFNHSALFRWLDARLSLQQKFKKLRSYREQKAWHYFEDRTLNTQDAENSSYRLLKRQIIEDGRRLGTPHETVQRMLELTGIDRKNDPIFASRWNVSKQAFLELNALSKKHHFQVLVVIIPYLESLDRYALSSVHEFIAKELREIGFNVLDLLPETQKINQEHLKIALDTSHFNAAGCRLLARFIYEITPWRNFLGE